ncbi:MAG TPA: SDR family oxidoreductase, partial [Pseudomonadales bacterium]|nr:SDR family oxidoreductase [Pseudomonadales bacterium]
SGTLASERLEQLKLALKPNQFCHYVPLNLTEPSCIESALCETLQTFKVQRLDGVFHLAGRLISKVFSETDITDFNQTLLPKVSASIALAKAVKAINEAASFVQFASVNAHFGGLNASVYSLANAAQFEIANALRDNGMKSYCLAWSQWAWLGMNEQLSAVESRLAERQGFLSIDVNSGMNSLLAVLSRKPDSVLVGLDASAGNVISDLDPVDINQQMHWLLLVAVATGGKKSDELLPNAAALKSLVSNANKLEQSLILQVDHIDRNAEGVAQVELLLNAGDATQRKTANARPLNSLEQKLADIWRSVLNCQQLSADSDFFAAGGHSLNAVQVISRINQNLNIDVGLADLFSFPVLENFALRIEKLEQNATNFAPIPRDVDVPPVITPAQSRLWFIQKFTQLPALWNVPIALEVKGDVKLSAMRQAMMDVLERHPALRVGYQDQMDGVLAVKELQITSLPFAVVTLPGQWQESIVFQAQAEEAQQPFDLSTQMPLRIKLIQFAESPQRSLLLITTHHLVSDGWSVGVLLREIALSYAAHANGLKNLDALLPSQPISYFDYAHWNQQQLQSGAYQAQLAYWKDQLAGLSGSLDLPTDFERPAQQTYFGDEYYFQLSQDQLERVKAFAAERKTTPFMVMLAVFQLLMARYTGQRDICVGTPVANRPRPELEDCIGLFINTVVLRNQLDLTSSFDDFLEQVKSVSLAAFSNQNVPFEHVVEAVKPERSASHSPLFQVMFIYQNMPVDIFNVAGISVSPRIQKSRLSKYDLSLQCFEYEGELRMSLEF